MSTTRHYETTVIVNGSLEEKQIEEAVDRVRQFIIKQGGELTGTEDWGRKRMAYPIQKKNNGYYVQFRYDAAGDMAKEIARFCRIDDDFLRELTLVMSDLDLRRREETKQRLAEAEAAAEAERDQEDNRQKKDSDDDD